MSKERLRKEVLLLDLPCGTHEIGVLADGFVFKKPWWEDKCAKATVVIER